MLHTRAALTELAAIVDVLAHFGPPEVSTDLGSGRIASEVTARNRSVVELLEDEFTKRKWSNQSFLEVEGVVVLRDR